MEPGHEDREYPFSAGRIRIARVRPQWSPVMKTGNTYYHRHQEDTMARPQWSPVMKTGNTMQTRINAAWIVEPQWSPVMKTGNTRSRPGASASPG